MKKLISIILFISTLSLSAQIDNTYIHDYKYKSGNYQPKSKGNGYKIAGVYLFSIITGAMADGYNDSQYIKDKRIGHALEAASIGSMLTMPLYIDIDRKQWAVY